MIVEDAELEKLREAARKDYASVKGTNRPWTELNYKRHLDMLEDAVVLYRLPHEKI